MKTRLEILQMILLPLIAASPVRSALGDVCSAPTFDKAGTFSAGTNAVFVAVGDFNGDGKLDLAVANANAAYTYGLTVLYGRGDGTFQNAIKLSAVDSAFSLAAGDFNGDGKTDLAVGGFGVSVLKGQGDHTFQNAFN